MNSSIRMAAVVLVTLCLCMATRVAAKSPDANAAKPSAGKMVPIPPAEGRYGHWLYLPKNFDKPGIKFPVLLYLHGSSSRGNDLNRLLRQGPPKHVRVGQHFPFVMVAAQAPAGTNWEPAKLKALLEHLRNKYPIDASRLYLTGLSRGGRGTYKTAAAYPDYFAAIAPAAPWAIDLGWAPKLAKVPIWAFHGDQDRVASFDDARQMVADIRRAGGHVRFTVYRGHDHNARNGWDPAYANPKFYQWLLAQRRGGPIAYELRVTEGSGSGFYPSGTPVRIMAKESIAAKKFTRWVAAKDERLSPAVRKPASGEGKFADAASPQTVFMTPPWDATLRVK